MNSLQCPPWRLTAAVCLHSMPLSWAGVVAREVAANARCAVGSWASPRLASVRVRPVMSRGWAHGRGARCRRGLELPMLSRR